jgi:hypothetical protein
MAGILPSTTPIVLPDGEYVSISEPRRRTRSLFDMVRFVPILLLVVVLAVACGGGNAGTAGTAQVEPTSAPASSQPTGLATQVEPTSAPASSQPTGLPTSVPQAAPKTTMAVDANADTPEIDAQASYPVGSEFTIAIVLQSTEGTYQGYQFDMAWDPAVVSYVSVEHLKPAGLETCSPTKFYTEGEFGGTHVAAFCVNTQLVPVDFTGPLSRVTLRCAQAGQSALHLRIPSDFPGTKVENIQLAPTGLHQLTLLDATVSCQ